MRCKIISLLFALIPLFSMAQSSANWHLFLNKKSLLSATTDSVAKVQLSKKDKGWLCFDFYNRDTSFKRSVLVMNGERNTLLQKELPLACKTASFSMDDLLTKTAGQAFTIYVADIPSDPKKAMLVRVAPQPICSITWKE